MGFFRREQPLHEKLAREGGLDFAREVRDLAPPDPIDPRHPFWQVTGIHGIPREREWDAVSSAEAPNLPGDRLARRGQLLVGGDELDPERLLGELWG